MALIINGTDGVQFNDASLQGAAASPYVLKNRIINGAMVISQRYGTSSSTMTSNVYSLDRYFNYFSSSGTATVQQSTTAPTGFVNSMVYTVGTADTSVGAGDYVEFEQRIEGYNVADLGFGTANAKTVTLSFWVRSSLIGTYCVNLRNNANNRAYIAEYTISVANTWEQKTVTIAGDTTGTWVTDNSTGLTVGFALMAGSTYQQAAGSWGATSYGFASSNQVNWMATSSNTFYITGVQLEQNTSATPFERRLYNQELANCQRYYQTLPFDGGYVAVGAVINTSSVRGPLFQLNVNMRAAPTITLPTAGSGAGQLHYTTGSGAVPGTIGTNSALGVQVNSFRVEGDTYTSMFTAGQTSLLRLGSGGASITASAEL